MVSSMKRNRHQEGLPKSSIPFLYIKIKVPCWNWTGGGSCVLEKERKRLRRLMDISRGPQEHTVHPKAHQEMSHKSAQEKSSKKLQQTADDLLFVIQHVLLEIYYLAHCYSNKDSMNFHFICTLFLRGTMCMYINLDYSPSELWV